MIFSSINPVFSEKKDVKVDCMYVTVHNKWPWVKGQNPV